MKHVKTHTKRNESISMMKVISGLVIVFFAMVMIFQRNKTTDLQFVRNMPEEFIHNAPNTQRDYLFQDEGGQQVYQGQISGTGTTNNDMNTLVNPDEVANIFESLVNGTGELYTGTMGTGTITKEPIYTGSLDCVTPRGDTVKNRDFVLAYAQRKDVNTICDIEKRVCLSGTLGGSFTQDSCKDDIVYDYNRAEIVSYNKKVLNEYIQPTAPINSGAQFDTQGQISGTESPTNTRGTTNSPVTNQGEVNQEPAAAKKSCTTPRGQKIKHGQFVKAYKTPRGFINLPCEVQIRPCVDGTLKGSYTYSKCTFNNITYDEYLTAGSPSSNTGFLFFERIKSILRRR